MPILENTNDYAASQQVTPTNLNLLTEAAKFVRSDGAVASGGYTTDETTIDIDGSGQLYIPAEGVDTAQLAAAAVETAKIADGHVTLAKMAAESVDSDQYVDGSIDEAHLAANAVASGALKEDVVFGLTESTAVPADADEMVIDVGGGGTALRKIGFDTILKHPAIPKAYGHVDPSTATVESGAYNITSIASLGSNNYRVTLAVTMADAFYTVLAMTVTSSSTNSVVSLIPSSRTTTTFDLNMQDTADDVHLAVFGALP